MICKFTNNTTDTIHGWREMRGQDPCGVCEHKCPVFLFRPIYCALAPGHEVDHNNGHFSWPLQANERPGA